jgi:[acyl-carrier-protein] S-malonyltransferase
MTVVMCSGQGAQKPGMGADLLEVPEVAEAFAQASEAFGEDLSAVVRDAEGTRLMAEPMLAQAATMAISVGVAQALERRGVGFTGAIGFSLGEISALAVTGVLPQDKAFELLKVRSQAMDEACQAHPGAMLAMLGVTPELAQQACDECAQGQVLVAANFNCPGQIVLSGEVEAIERAEAWWKERKKRARRLNTAGAFHSPLMQDAADALRVWCEGVEFSEPKVPLICNTDAKDFDAAQAADRLSRQLVSPVLFEQGIRELIGRGETHFVEAGFGGVLFNLLKRIDPEVERQKVGTLEQLQELTA